MEQYIIMILFILLCCAVGFLYYAFYQHLKDDEVHIKAKDWDKKN